MRFGKRLTELQNQNGQLNQPYISYKELKRAIGDLARLAASTGDVSASKIDAADSSGDEAGPPEADERQSMGASSSSSSVKSQLEEQQKNFFKKIDDDVASAVAHIRNIISTVEVGIGDWQCQAAASGVLFTPAQLDEVAATLPFECSDQQVLVQWLSGLQTEPGPSLAASADGSRPVRLQLAERYSYISSALQVLLQYIEVNVTAVRKILKKFDKKMPFKFQWQSTQNYKAHHSLFSTDLQDLVVTAVQMYRLIVAMDLPEDSSVRTSTSVSPISFMGPESLQVLQQLKVVPELNDMIVGNHVVNFVYAKPGSNDNRGPGAKATPSASATTSAAKVATADVSYTAGGSSSSRPSGMQSHGSQLADNSNRSGSKQSAFSKPTASHFNSNSSSATTSQGHTGSAAGKGTGKRGNKKGDNATSGQQPWQGSNQQGAQGKNAAQQPNSWGSGAGGQGKGNSKGGKAQTPEGKAGGFNTNAGQKGKQNPPGSMSKGPKPSQGSNADGSGTNLSGGGMFMMVPVGWNWNGQSNADQMGNFKGAGAGGKAGGQNAAMQAMQQGTMPNMQGFDYSGASMMQQPFMMPMTPMGGAYLGLGYPGSG